ncbi:hypothetical protein Tco_0205984 [Tanacetum coccineum]
MAEQDIPPPTITAMKISIIRKGEYDIWSMRMRQYICHIDHNLWDVIVNGDLEEEPAPIGDQSGPSAPPAPKTTKQLAARRNQERVKSIFLLAIPDEYLLKFHNVANAKSLWEAIKSSLDKAYDRFQKLISQLEVHGAPISKEDINQKFLRSLPSSWNQIALIMRNKPDIDEIDIDDLYNNLSTNEVSTASGDFGVSTAGGINQVPSTPCAHDVAYSFLAQPTTPGGCQFLGRRLISWQCKKQTIVANSTTEAEYVAAANCCGQVLWIHNQMMHYGFNFMNTKIHIDNESTISVIKNPIAHSRTKHIEIHFHFIRDCYEKRLIEVIKIHTDSNVADLLTKGFDVTRFNFLVVSIGLLNL